MEKDEVIKDLEIRASILEEQLAQDNKSKRTFIDIDIIDGNMSHIGQENGPV